MLVVSNKIVCADWIGRFGNRCHSYLYGKHIEDKLGLKFYIPSKWEGCFIFENPASVYTPMQEKRFKYAGGSEKNKSTFDYNSTIIKQINRETNDEIEFVDTCREKNYNKKNLAYISLMTDAPWFFPKVTHEDIRKYFKFNEDICNTDMYKELYDLQGTYDVAHFRRTDIASKTYVGGHSLVSKHSYTTAFKKFDQDPDDVLWISDEPSFGWKYNKKLPSIGGRRILWIADFLKLVFARRIFRSNSSFSLFGSWISKAEVFAPWLHEYTPGVEVDFEFVNGNYPHWMAVKGVHTNYMFDLKGLKHDNDFMEITKNKQIKQVSVKPKSTKDVVMMVHWNGRFGNRMGSYAFGRTYAEKYDLDFYIPSKWEGTHLFKDTGAKIIEDDNLRLRINQTDKQMDNLSYRSKAVAEHCKQNNLTPIKYMNPDDPSQYGNKNVFFDSLAVNGPHIFKDMSRNKILKWFEFNDDVKNLDIYKIMEDNQGTYDIAHLRRDDISSPRYNKNNHQGYSVVSKQSYLNAFDKFGFDVSEMEWTTDDWTGKWGVGKPKYGRGGWSYPEGSRVMNEIIFDWLPDFLRLYFARNIFRGNSSFSWWAAFLSPTATTYSPVLTERKIYFEESDEVKFDFVKGNHPHWLNYKGNPKNLAEEIIIPD